MCFRGREIACGTVQSMIVGKSGFYMSFERQRLRVCIIHAMLIVKRNGVRPRSHPRSVPI
jgi:hypothetical protein